LNNMEVIYIQNVKEFENSIEVNDIQKFNFKIKN
jgi:hypothetical protein